jgi:biofilm PGA synthesis N-glycosyltransferase PgaC
MTSAHFLAQTLPSLLFGFVFYYPFFMAWVWMAGGLSHAMVFERKRDVDVDPLDLLPPAHWSPWWCRASTKCRTCAR